MKQERFVLWLAIAAAGSLLAGPPQPLAARADVDIRQQSQAPFASIKEVKPFTYCALAHKGPLTDMSGVIGQLMQAMRGQNLFPSIQGPMVGVYYNSPDQVKPEELSWEVGFQVSEQASSQAPLVKKTWKYPIVAAALHIGPYAKTGETIQRLVQWIGARGYDVAGPILERYLNNPMQVKPAELKTEIWIPAKKI